MFSNIKPIINKETCQICPKVPDEDEDDLLASADHMSDFLDTSMTPKALKNLSKSVMDLSTLKEMKEISKSTSNLMTGGVLDQITKKKKTEKKGKSESKTSLLKSSTESLSTIDVGLRSSLAFSLVMGQASSLSKGSLQNILL